MPNAGDKVELSIEMNASSFTYVEIIYNKTMQNKFAWAANTPANFWRKYPN